MRAVIDNGNVILDEPLNVKGRFDAVVVVLDLDPWDSLIHDPRPRPDLLKVGGEALEEFRQGKTTPLDPDNMP